MGGRLPSAPTKQAELAALGSQILAHLLIKKRKTPIRGSFVFSSGDRI